MFTGMTAWQFLLWVVALTMLLVPLLIILGNGIFIGYFKAKELFFGHILKALGDVIAKLGDEMAKKKPDKPDMSELARKIVEEAVKQRKEGR